MEQLAKTCKTLYDKEFLDNQKLFKQGYSHQKVLYDSIQEYNELEEEFRTQLPEVIKNIGLDDWGDIYMRHMQLEFDWIMNKNFYELTNALLKLIKNNKKAYEIFNIIYLTLDGIVRSCDNIYNYNENTICEECSSDIECNDCETIIQTSYENIFLNKKFCNKMITNMILNILFSDTSGTEGVIDDIRQFKCKKCGKFEN